MSIEVGMSSAGASAAQDTSRSRHGSVSAKPLFEPGFWVVGNAQQRLLETLDLDGDGGLDPDELKALGGLGAGKNGPAGFAAVDRDADGRLNLRELQASKIFSPETLNMLLGQQAGNGLAEWLVAQGDGDADGALDRDEFRKIGPEGDLAERAFDAADANGDGLVSAEELPAAMRSFVRAFPSYNPSAVAADLMRHDADASGGLTRDELAQASETGAVDLNAIFELADANADGALSLAELQAQISQAPEYYSLGVRRLPAALRPIDPRAPDYVDQVRDRLTAAAALEPPPPGQEALLRLLRENFARLTEQMIAGINPPAPATIT